eukprot:7242057-Lingulodinium_polyedra.AAC.1
MESSRAAAACNRLPITGWDTQAAVRGAARAPCYCAPARCGMQETNPARPGAPSRRAPGGRRPGAP